MVFHPLNIKFRLPRPEFNGEQFHSLTPISPTPVELTIDQDGLLWSSYGTQLKREEYSGELRFVAYFAPEYNGGYGRGRAEFCAILTNGAVARVDVANIRTQKPKV